MKKVKKYKRIKRTLCVFVVVCMMIVLGRYYGYSYYLGLLEQQSVELSTHLKKTNTDAAVYSTKEFVTKSKLYLPLYYSAIKNRQNEVDNGTYIIPGLKATRTLKDGQIDMCTMMTPQGICIAENYILISAYCRNHNHNSVIYVINKEKHRFVKEIILPRKAHCGGIAYDNQFQNIWVCSKAKGVPKVSAFSLMELKKYSPKEGKPIKYEFEHSVYDLESVSFMTYHQGSLYVGCYSEEEEQLALEFKLNENGKINERLDDSGVYRGKYTSVSKISKEVQGMAFYNNRVIFSRSNGPVVSSKLEIFDKGTRGYVDRQHAKVFVFPERMEQVYVDGDDLYIVFEAASNAYNKIGFLTVDRVVKVDLRTLIGL